MPQPRGSDPHELRGHWVLKEGLAPGTAFSVAGGAIIAKVPFAGAARGRIRILTTGAGGNLDGAWLRPDALTPYAANNPTTVPVTVDVETKLDVDPHFGEGVLELTFTPGGTGTIVYVDASQV